MANKAFVLLALVVLVGFAACDATQQQDAPLDDTFGDQPDDGIPEAGDGAAQQFQCPDGTLVEDPAECPPA